MTHPEQQFLGKVIARDRNPDGTDKGIVRRMQNEICIRCHEVFKKKFPGEQFDVKCSGIYDQPDYEDMRAKLKADGEDMSINEIREIYDASFWAERNMVVKNDEGDIVPFVPRDYQVETMRCTSPRKVDRWGRGTGKTMMGIGVELHQIFTKKKFPIVIVVPAQAQAELWYQEILFQIDNSPRLQGSVVQKKQQPYYYLRFGNQSTVAIFTAGSKSGKGADAVRGQNPRRIRLDEQDYLSDKDYKAIMPLLRRFKNSQFHGSSTPTGFRTVFWEMCNRWTQYREFYVPITRHPEWGTDELNEKTCILEAKTMDRYRHEYLAEFGDPASGVFKGMFVDAARKPYLYGDQAYQHALRYFMGVDWNGKGTGTRICITAYNPQTRMRRKVYSEAVDSEGSTTMDSINRIVQLNREWLCEEVYIDSGFGFAQDELIRDVGARAAKSVVDARLKFIKTVNFGAKLSVNKLVPNRDPNSKYLPDDDDQLERLTKPFMVEGTVMAFEMNLVEISNQDKLLEEQLRGYKIKSYTKGDLAAAYVSEADSGDHDLDAFMLSMLGIELKYGLWHTPETVQRLVSIAHVSGWGMPATSTSAGAPGVRKLLASAPSPTPAQIVATRQAQAGVPSRSIKSASAVGKDPRILYHLRNGAMMAPGTSPAGKILPGERTPSRTEMFQGGRTSFQNRFQRRVM